jgi:hypothetical protein
MELFKMIYNLPKKDKNENKIKILGAKFVENNKNKCTTIIGNKKHRLNEHFDLSDNKNENLKVIIMGYNFIYNKDYMFKDCKSLIEFSDYNYDTNLFLNEENTLSNKIDKKKNDIFYNDLNPDFSLENNNNNSFYFSTVKLFTDNEEEEDENIKYYNFIL